MWDVWNETPFAADRAILRDMSGAEVWVVAVKGTFDLHPDGETSVAGEQLEVFHAARFRDDPATSSVLYDMDMVLRKPTTDVLLNACAYPEGGGHRRHADVALTIGPIRKNIRVIGDRTWERGLGILQLSEPQPFDRLPIIYERAFGGRDPDAADPGRWPCEARNPVGVGFSTRAEFLVGTPAPNLEAPGSPLRSWDDRPAPIGFGAIASHWQPRVRHAGTYDSKWEAERYPLLPSDFDPRFFQCAPSDQQAPIGGGEVVRLRNLTPNGELQFRLPSVTLGLTTVIGGEAIDHRASLHTVVIEPEFPRVVMVWHSALNCHRRSLRIDGTTVWIKHRLAAGG